MKSGFAYKNGFAYKLKSDVKKNTGLYILVLPALAFLILFSYVPMYGVILGFKEYDSLLGIMGSPFVGFDNFRRFFTGYYFADVMWNTFSISLYSLALGFPLPIIFALMINSVGNGKFKRTVQMISYAPYFISSVVIVALITAFFDTSTGVVSNFLRLFNPNASQNTLNSASAFKTVFVLSGVWQSLGWSCIIYIAALSGVDPQMYEAATLDGASKMQKIIYIDIPSIAPTMITLLILSMGNILSVGFEKVYLMQNPDNLASSEVIATYVYKKGLLSSDYGFGTAVGLFNSLINFAMLAVTNFVAKKTAGYSLW